MEAGGAGGAVVFGALLKPASRNALRNILLSLLFAMDDPLTQTAN